MSHINQAWGFALALVVAGSCRSGIDELPLVENQKKDIGEANLDASEPETLISVEEVFIEHPEHTEITLPVYEVIISSEGDSFSGIFRSCNEIKQQIPEAPDGIYPLRLPAVGGGTEDVLASCDMSAEGGGWTLILNYVKAGLENPALMIRDDNLPLLGPARLGESEALSMYWGHASNIMARRIGGEEFRFLCQTNEHNRLLHFRSNAATCLRYALTGQGSCADIRQNFAPLTGHNSFLPRAQETGGLNQMQLALTEATIQGTFGTPRFWNVGGRRNNGTWDCDNDTRNSTYQTIHRVWIR